MKPKIYFPVDEKSYRDEQQALRIEALKRQQRSEHHGIVPVVYTAAAAAFVFHHPFLERAEEEYADHIAYRVCDRDQYENTAVYDVEKEKAEDEPVKKKPASRYYHRRMGRLSGIDSSGKFFSGRYIV